MSKIRHSSWNKYCVTEIVMSEMLGNQYFMGRKYPEAQKEFELELAKQPNNLFMQKRLIICYTQTGSFEKAFELFFSLIERDIEFISDSDPLRDDCPCPELVAEMKSSVDLFNTEFQKEMISGIIWSYCDLHIAEDHFQKAKELEPHNIELSKLLKLVRNYVNKRNLNSV